MALDYAGMDVPASFGDYMQNNGRIIWLFVRLDTFCALLCSILVNNILQPTRSSWWHHFIKFVRPLVLNKRVKFCDLSLNRSLEKLHMKTPRGWINNFICCYCNLTGLDIDDYINISLFQLHTYLYNDWYLPSNYLLLIFSVILLYILKCLN